MTANVVDLMKRVKRLITMPPDDTLFDEEDYIAFINECLFERILPRLMKIKDDYNLVRDVFPLQNSQAVDLYPTGVMPIPPRAWGNTLREVKYIDISGNYYKVNPYYLQDIDLYQARNLAFSSAFQKGFIPFNSGIKLIPPPLQDNGSIEMHYILTPSELISDINAAAGFFNMQFDSQTNIATYQTELLQDTLDGYCAPGATAVFDIFNYPTGMLVATDVVLTRDADTFGVCSNFSGVCTVQIGTNIISPNIQELTNFQAGGFPLASFPNPSTYGSDLYLLPAGQSPYTTIPPILDNLLVYEVAIKLLSAQGYIEELQLFMKEHDDMRKDLLSQMAQRVECEPPVLSNKRGIRSSILYGAMRTRRNT